MKLSPWLLGLVLLICNFQSILSLNPQAQFDVHVLGLSGVDGGMSQSTDRESILSYAQVALLKMSFNQPMYLREGSNHSIVDSLPLRDPASSFGLTRLICGHRLIESHPSIVTSNRPPLFLIPLSPNSGNVQGNSAKHEEWNTYVPLLTMFQDYMIGSSKQDGEEDPSSIMYFALLLASSRVEDTGVSFLDYSLLKQGCSLQFLPLSSQSWSPGVEVVDENGVPFHGSVPVSLSKSKKHGYDSNNKDSHNNKQEADNIAVVEGDSTSSPTLSSAILINERESKFSCAADDDDCSVCGGSKSISSFPDLMHSQITSSSRILPSLYSPSSSLSYTSSVNALVQSPLSKALRSLILFTMNKRHPGPSLLESKVRVKAKMAGMVTGLVEPVVEPVASTMGDITGGTMVGKIAAPLVTNLAATVSAYLNEGLEPMITQPLEQKIVPALSSTIPKGGVDAVANGLTEYLAKELPGPINAEVTPQLDKSVAGPSAKAVTDEGTTIMCHKLTYNLANVLPKAISHAVVPSLIHAVTRAPLMDYYCYYCSTRQMYCSYCTRSENPGQVYYALYYTGFYSQHYAPYYALHFANHLGVKIIRKGTGLGYGGDLHGRQEAPCGEDAVCLRGMTSGPAADRDRNFVGRMLVDFLGFPKTVLPDNYQFDQTSEVGDYGPIFDLTGTLRHLDIHKIQIDQENGVEKEEPVEAKVLPQLPGSPAEVAVGLRRPAPQSLDKALNKDENMEQE